MNARAPEPLTHIKSSVFLKFHRFPSENIYNREEKICANSSGNISSTITGIATVSRIKSVRQKIVEISRRGNYFENKFACKSKELNHTGQTDVYP